jgi:aryl carrier-like protein
MSITMDVDISGVLATDVGTLEADAADARGALDLGAIEELLAAVWSEVLDGTPVGRTDNFFDLGGDSLLVIETVAVAREEGLDFSPVDLIENPTVAELAARILVADATVSTEADEDDFPLTSAHRRLWTGQPHPRYVTQSVLWRADGLDRELLGAALDAVVRHHASFRLRLITDQDGRARLRYADDAGFVLGHTDLAGRPAEDRAVAIMAESTRLQRSVDPVDGPTVRAALLDLGEAGQRLFVTAHHVAVDSASWRILRGDLVRAYRRLHDGRPVDLPAEVTPVGVWARRTVPRAAPDAAAADLRAPAQADGALPWARRGRREAGGAPVERSTVVTVHTSDQVTETLLHRVRAETGAGMDAVVLAAVARAVARTNGMDRVCVEIERHGRDTAPADLDISRTTGWFTRLQTVLLDPARAPMRALIRATDRRVNGEGPDFATEAVPAVLVNYLGRFTDRGEDLLGEADEAFVNDRHPDNRLTHPIEVHAAVNGTRLVTVITCDGNAPAAACADELGAAYAAVLEQMAAELRQDAP